jgi:hypothetical protein
MAINQIKWQGKVTVASIIINKVLSGLWETLKLMFQRCTGSYHYDNYPELWGGEWCSQNIKHSKALSWSRNLQELMWHVLAHMIVWPTQQWIILPWHNYHCIMYFSQVFKFRLSIFNQSKKINAGSSLHASWRVAKETCMLLTVLQTEMCL